MQDDKTYEYAILRVVPKVEKGEFMNAGVIIYCLALDFLEARIHLDEPRLLALDPGIDMESVRAYLATIPLICAGGEGSGPIGQLSRRERFQWLVSPRSTMVQTSPVHTGRTSDPAQVLEHLVQRMVMVSPGTAS